MQFLIISNNFIYLCQLGGLKQRSTLDAGIALIYSIHIEWVKHCTTSILAFYIAQFFPLLNHQVLSLVLDKASFDPKVLIFFQNYLVDRKIKYLWNSFFFSFFNVDIGVGQESALAPILSALYLSPIFHIFEKHLKNLKILISFVDNKLLISQDKSILVSNTNLFCSYNVISNLLTKVGLIIEHRKTEVFHFSRSQGIFDPSLFDLTPLKGSVLWPKTTWHYLRFIFN